MRPSHRPAVLMHCLCIPRKSREIVLTTCSRKSLVINNEAIFNGVIELSPSTVCKGSEEEITSALFRSRSYSTLLLPTIISKIHYVGRKMESIWDKLLF